jgi:diguanylate cyclase (GGDEF)-like protein
MGSRYILTESPLVIGRGDDCQVCVSDDAVSRQHLQVAPVPGGYHVADLGSTNGTFVNDQLVERRKLRDGDYLRVGSQVFRYLAEGNAEARYHEEIYRLTIIDAQTGLYNRRYLLDFLDRELSRSRRYQRPLALVLFDVDGLKAINDRLGHLAGDAMLRDLAQHAQESVRREELLARYGGDEFAAVLPEAKAADAYRMAERLRERIERHVFRHHNASFSATVSLGIATTCGNEPLCPEELIRQADAKLYAAKAAGKNRVTQ